MIRTWLTGLSVSTIFFFLFRLDCERSRKRGKTSVILDAASKASPVLSPGPLIAEAIANIALAISFLIAARPNSKSVRDTHELLAMRQRASA